jgi:hypothetical protein
MNLHTTTSAQKERPVKDCYECEGKKNWKNIIWIWIVNKPVSSSCCKKELFLFFRWESGNPERWSREVS